MQRYKVHNPPVRYSFTHEGRVAAHKLTGVLDSDEVQSRCQKLTAAVKAHVTDEVNVKGLVTRSRWSSGTGERGR